MTPEQLESLLLAALDSVLDTRAVAIAPKWADGTLILQPKGDTQSKEVPIDIFFKKLTSLRENLRVLEQKINNHESLPSTDKATLQAYITKCYGSLTTFNVLFRNEGDRFVGSAGGGCSGSGSKSNESEVRTRKDKAPAMTLAEAKRKLGLPEHGNE